MKLFSNRKRPLYLGPYPFERLKRAPSAQPARLRHTDTPLAPTNALGNIAREYTRIFGEADQIPIESSRVAGSSYLDIMREIKATCHFLDASATGVCHVEGGPPKSHTALVILVEPGKQPDPGTSAAEWATHSAPAVVSMRATEIAVVLAGYIRQLGYDAHVHPANANDPNLMSLAVAAGIGRTTTGGLEVPFVEPGYGLSAVLTSLPLTPDKPLKPSGSLHSPWLRIVKTLGLGGVRSNLHERRMRRRPSHLGRYPMERIDRTVVPTTLILDDEVPRVPKRANFFERAGHGDLGPKAQRERDRFATKHPLAYAMSPLMRALVPLQDGPIAPTKSDDTKNATANARSIKSLAYMLGADLVGIGKAVSYAWYSHDEEGRPLPIRHKYAIVMMIDQGFETSEGSSGDDWISGSQSMRAYLRGAEIGGVLAAHLRNLGHSARAHTNKRSDVLHLPLILQAGLGELSRIGELILNPFLGPRSKSVVVTTDMPLDIDQPIDFGLQDFCSKCRKCARECPCNAISYKNKVMFNGYEIWKPDVERCTRYRVTNPKGSSCGRCMKVCPFTNEGLVTHRFFLWLAIHIPMTRRFIIQLDDILKNGERNPIKRWWRDIQRSRDGSVEPATGTNERDLKLHSISNVPASQQIAYYPATVMPPPYSKDAKPLDRQQALAIESTMETPEQALARRGSAAVLKRED